MLSREEIQAKLILLKRSQASVAEEIGITRSRFSVTIGDVQGVASKLTQLFGENPFQMNQDELDKAKAMETKPQKIKKRKTRKK